MGKSSKKSSVKAAPAAVSVPEGKSAKKGKAFHSSIVAMEIIVDYVVLLICIYHTYHSVTRVFLIIMSREEKCRR